MSDQYLTPAQFAKQIGISRQAVYLAKDSGLIPTIEIEGKLKIDVTDKRVQDYVTSRERKSVIPTGSKTLQSAKPVKLKSSILSENMQPVVPAGEIPEYLRHLVDDEKLTLNDIMELSKAEVDKIKSYEMIKTIRQKREQSRNVLIDQKLLRSYISITDGIQRNQFLTLKTKLVPDLAGVFGCTDEIKKIECEKIIDTQCHIILKQVQYEIRKFLKQIEELK